MTEPSVRRTAAAIETTPGAVAVDGAGEPPGAGVGPGLDAGVDVAVEVAGATRPDPIAVELALARRTLAGDPDDVVRRIRPQPSRS